MKRLCTILLLLLGAILQTKAQEGVYEIHLVDAEEGVSVPFATLHVTCLAAGCKDSSLTIRTDKGGRASLPFVPPVIVSVSHVAYLPLIDTILSTNAVDRPEENAQRITLLLRPNVHSGDQVVVTGQYRPTENNQSVYQVRVITEEEIKARGANTLRDLMGSEVNVRVSQDNILGSGLSVQGISGQNVKILVDGVPVIGRVGGNIDISQLLLNNVERIEIVEGPLSVAYGTDALGGVINVITNKKTPTTFSAEANTWYESVGTWNVDGRVGMLLNKGRIVLSGGRHFFGGFSQPDTSRAKQWKPREQYFIDWSGTWYSGTFTFEYTGKYFNEYILNRGLPRAPYGETAFDETYRTNRLTNRIQARGTLGEDHVEFSAAFSDYTRRRNTWFKDLTTLQEQLTPLAEDQDTSGFQSWNIRGTYSSHVDSGRLSWQGGVDANLDLATGDRIESTERSVEDYAVFGSLRYSPLHNISFQPGLRFAWNSGYKAPLIPSFNAKYNPDSAITVRASYARGFRAPSLRDLYFLFVDINHNIKGNESLLAEVSNNFNASVSWAKNRSDYQLEFTGAGFYNNIKNLITLVNVQDDLYTYQNIGTYRSTGVSLTGEYNTEAISVSLAGAVIGRYNMLSEAEQAPQFSFSPELTATYQWKIPSIADWAVDYKYTGRLPSYALASNGNVQEQSVDDYHTLNSSLSRSFFNDAVTLRVGIKNLFDVTDIESSSVDGGVHSSTQYSLPVSWGRTFFTTLNVAIK